jgi:sugar phosphate isomerase/epimerase
MIIGAMNNPHKELVEQIYFFGENNFDYLELTIEYPHATAQKLLENKRKIFDALNSYNLGLLAHLAWYFPIAHPYDSIRSSTIKEIEKAISVCANFGAKILTIHPDLSTPLSSQSRKSMFSNTLSSLKAISDKAKVFGIELCIETVDQNALNIKEIKELINQLSIGLTLDIGHSELFFSGGFKKLILEFKPNIKHVHLHDYKNTINHLPLGIGGLDLKEVVNELKKFYNNSITLEVHSANPKYLLFSKDLLEIYWYGKKEFEENKKYFYPDS